MPDYRQQARMFAVQFGIDPDIFERQILKESGFDPNAYNARSGATGIAQIIPRYHPTVNPRDPIASLRYAARWMSQMIAQYGGWVKALVGYNAGPGVAEQWNGTRQTLNAESREYLDFILGPDWSGAGGGGIGLPTIDPGDIGEGITGAIRRGLTGFWNDLQQMPKTVIIQNYSTQIFSALGIILLLLGLLGIAVQSPPGRIAVDTVAATGNPIQGAARVVQRVR